MEIKLDESNLHTISDNAEKKAEMLFDSAEVLAKKEKYSSAFCLLVFALEECAKNQLLVQYNHDLSDRKRYEKDGKILQNGGIDEILLKKIFLTHEKKQYLVLMQTILSFANTFDKEKHKLIHEAIMTKNPHKDSDIKQILKVFKNLQKRRENAVFASTDATKYEVTKEEYYDLSNYAKESLKFMNRSCRYKYKSYEKVYDNIKVMLDKIH